MGAMMVSSDSNQAKSREMYRSQYLGSDTSGVEPHAVREFIDWLAGNLSSKTLFMHEYIDRRSGRKWQFNGLEDACERYQWKHRGVPGVPPGNTLASNADALDALRTALQSALACGNDHAACDAACAVMRWGGVGAGNIRWLQTNTEGLAKLLCSTTAVLDSGNPGLLHKNLRFNAGMTKVYSLLAEDFIIYDSRVAAALGWLVVKYCQENGLSRVPEGLAFPWAPSKEAPNAAVPKNRNPGRNGLSFPRLNPGPLHAEWNLKASWILGEVLRRDKTSQFVQPSSIPALRRLEAALFMIGYDLPRSDRAAQAVPSSIPAPHPAWTECYTTARQKQFHYRIDDTGILLKRGSRFPVDVINRMLNNLREECGDAPFRLANSATQVRANEAEFGIGTAYFRATYDRGNPPDSSALAAVLADIGVLLFSPDRNEWSLNAAELCPDGHHGPIDVKWIIEREIEP